MPQVINLLHQRMYHDENHTLGYILYGGNINYILEDGKRKIKIAGETRIPAGTYEIKFRKILTPLTKKYRKNYEWFTWHLELQGVKKFSNVYDHIGNFHEDTDGCRLHGLTPSNPRIASRHMITHSKIAFKAYYEYVSEKLNSGVKIYTTIIDEVKG